MLTAGLPGGTIESVRHAIRNARPSPRPSPTIDGIAARLRPFLREKNVLKAIVFGSWARGTNTRRSDLDLAVVLQTNRAFLDRRQDLRGIEDVLDGLHPELLIYAPGELEAISHRPFIRRVLSEGITIYER